MDYKVELTAEARSNIRDIYGYIGASESQAAARWYRGLRQLIFSLDRLPGRGSSTSEDRWLKQLLYGNKPHVYRIIYRINEHIRRVLVVHIRHGAGCLPARGRSRMSGTAILTPMQITLEATCS